MAKRLTKVEFTNLDKVLFPQQGITKSQVIEYYIRMAPRMLDFLAGRPATLNRFPDGVNREGFYEKNAPTGTPPWVDIFRRHSQSADRDISYVLCNNLDTLIWMANLASIEVHVCLSKADSFETPDFALFDVDPEPPMGAEEVIQVSLLLKEKLESLGMRPYVKTSGKKGLHVIVPVHREYTFKQTREFVHGVGKSLTKDVEYVVAEFSQSKDPGTVFIDYLQNADGRTMVSPYSLRPTPGATVSMPLEWKEVKKGLKFETFNLSTVIRAEGSPWKGMLKDRQKLEVI
ncbi:MAG TPA: non-homologous end-joining DNA ligase [Candidatus Bathyarchaeia archaeon]|nr:non-homologous end-joining DNA ligase [Candidatus Bathyarchaeia archaeon]